jgi:hypothetical protein
MLTETVVCTPLFLDLSGLVLCEEVFVKKAGSEGLQIDSIVTNLVIQDTS